MAIRFLNRKLEKLAIGVLFGNKNGYFACFSLNLSFIS
ncbi:hypothetical protein SOVF_152330 [Spinacia oleracea]|nr:hypothetical protein SOVF_152330 [Spinacia oleracea]